MIEALRTYDVGACLEVLTEPKIFDAISEDGATHSDLKIDVQNQIWLEILDCNELIGVVQFKPMFKNCYDAHIQILPKYRKYSIPAGEAIVDYIQRHLSGCLIYTNVPVICRNVRNFLIEFDFKITGYLEKAFTKNGELVDMWILTRRF